MIVARVNATDDVVESIASLQLLVTGCPHSGTRFISEILTTSGMPCGHEAVWALDGVHPATRIAESSWIAAAHPVPPVHVAVAHQVREPLAWLNSWLRTMAMPGSSGFPAWRPLELGWPTILEQHERDPVTTAMRLWIDLNQRVARYADRRYRVEELVADARGCEIVSDLGLIAGVALDPQAIRTALADLSLDRNHHTGASDHRPLTWGSLPRGPTLDAMIALGREYGYSCKDGEA